MKLTFWLFSRYAPDPKTDLNLNQNLNTKRNIQRKTANIKLTLFYALRNCDLSLHETTIFI